MVIAREVILFECKTSEGYVFRIQCHVAPVKRPIISPGLLLTVEVSTVLEMERPTFVLRAMKSLG